MSVTSPARSRRRSANSRAVRRSPSARPSRSAHRASSSRLFSRFDFGAAGRYDVAHTVDPDNPLPLLGKGHALIGAGEYRTAVMALLQGIARFPDIARFRLDLRELLGADQLLDVRRADLENRLNDPEDYEMRFLLGYIEYYSGMPDFGLEHLDTAAADAPPESVIRRFVQLVREQATPAAATQPAL